MPLSKRHRRWSTAKSQTRNNSPAFAPVDRGGKKEQQDMGNAESRRTIAPSYHFPLIGLQIYAQ
jgi:hypothetical protein